MFPNDEWSGMLFYKVIEGGLENPSKMTLECIDLHLKDIGDGHSTEWINDESAIQIYMKKPKLMECRSGLIHSHNIMDCFFSHTDMEELEDNSVGIDYYLSLIINNRTYSNWEAKLAIQGKEEVTTIYKFVGKLKDLFNTEDSSENPALFTYDMDIEIIAEGVLGEIAENTMAVAAEIAKRAPKYPAYPGVSYVQPNLHAGNKVYPSQALLGYEDEGWKFQDDDVAERFFGAEPATFNGKPLTVIQAKNQSARVKDDEGAELEKLYSSIFMGMSGVINSLPDSVKKMVKHLKSPVEYNKFAAQKVGLAEGIIEKKFGKLTTNFTNEVIIDFMNALQGLKVHYHGNSKEYQLCEAVLSAFSAEMGSQLELDIPR